LKASLGEDEPTARAADEHETNEVSCLPTLKLHPLLGSVLLLHKFSQKYLINFERI